MAEVGKNIKILRTKKEMSQDELAEKLFVSRQTVSNYETGKTNPDIETIVKIAEIFNTEANCLIYGLPSEIEKKKQYKALILKSVFLFIFIVGAFVLNKYSIFFRRRYFDLSLTFLLNTVYLPLLFLFLSYICMQASSIFLGAKPIKFSNKKMIFYILIGILVVYFLTVLPYNIFFLKTMYEYQIAIKNRISYSFSGFSISPFLDNFVYHFAINSIYKYVFLIYGVLLWIFKPNKIKKEEKQDE